MTEAQRLPRAAVSGELRADVLLCCFPGGCVSKVQIILNMYVDVVERQLKVSTEGVLPGT